VRRAIRVAGEGLVERGSLVETVALAAVAGEHLLVIGPPGTAKSEAVRRIARALGGNYFEYLIGRFTEPTELFGPIDLRRLREGVVETATEGMLPEAEIAFLDEIFLGSTAILNTLLALLNERIFRRGHTIRECPLRVCVGAANALPTEETLAAFADRFLLRVFVDGVADPMLEELLEGGWSLVPAEGAPAARLTDLDVLGRAARQADLAPVRPALAQALRTLRAAGIVLTDRRAVKAQRLIAAAATLDGRREPTRADLWPLVLAVPGRDEQLLAREVLAELLEPSTNASLPRATEEASRGPAARAGRLAEAGRALLEGGPEAGDGAAWRLKVEGVAREIDASFAPGALPEALAEVRSGVAAALQTAPPPSGDFLIPGDD
jgi:MoxR-like ATPase